MMSSGIIPRPLISTIVISALVTQSAGVLSASDEYPPTDDVDEIFTPPFLDVVRLWLRATVVQAHRVVDTAHLMLSPTVAILGVVGALALVRLYRLLFMPIDRVKLLGDVGYVGDGRQSMSDVVEQVKRRRDVGDVPPVYPNGWFALTESRRLNIGEVMNVCCLGKNLAVYRGEDGRAHALDAYCCHNGANMATGGLVKGSCLECPFHGWHFRGDDGKCTHIPYCDRSAISDVARVTSYSTMERNGFVFIWYHAEGIDPGWEPPEIDKVGSGLWKYCGRSEHFINAHIEEVPENGADLAHLSQVHGPIMTAGVDLRFMYSKWWSFARHDWHGEWNPHPDAEQKHVGVMTLLHGVQIFGWRFPVLDLKVCAKQIGPGIVNLEWESLLFGRGAFLQVLTPVEPLMLRMIHHVYCQRWLPTVVAKFFLYSEALMVERDLMIWNNKRYVSRPLFVKSKEDALIQRHRRWYSQFYSERSPHLNSTYTTDKVDW